MRKTNTTFCITHDKRAFNVLELELTGTFDRASVTVIIFCWQRIYALYFLCCLARTFLITFVSRKSLKMSCRLYCHHHTRNQIVSFTWWRQWFMFRGEPLCVGRMKPTFCNTVLSSCSVFFISCEPHYETFMDAHSSRVMDCDEQPGILLVYSLESGQFDWKIPAMCWNSAIFPETKTVCCCC